MTTYYHTPVSVDSQLTALQLTYPMGQLDFAIHQLAHWELDWPDMGTLPATPAAGYAWVYIRNGRLTVMDDIGVERVVHIGDQYACVVDEKANVDGGTSAGGGWRTRDLNKIVSDTTGLVSLDSNQITLKPGSYRIRASAPGTSVNNRKARWQNITAGETIVYSQPDDYPMGRSYLSSQFTISVESVFELQHFFATAFSGGEGSLFDHAIYSIVEIWKV